MGGMLIVFEGGEGAGKTTQIERSRAWLHQHLAPEIPVIATREPGGTPLGGGIRRLLLEEQLPCDRAELLLYAADRAQHVADCLKPALNKGAIVLCDRYTDSTIAYQGYGRGLDLHLIQQLNAIATGGLQSDLTLWLDVDVEVGLKRVSRRGKSDRLEKTEFAFHQRVRQGFAQLAATPTPRRIRVDANGSVEEVALEIERILSQTLSFVIGKALV
ncbi:MAG: dTMP kinase [Cyanobacteriota bacterium]|nr:dTMP kinase [Cyanobacteriota bacterium]